VGWSRVKYGREITRGCHFLARITAARSYWAIGNETAFGRTDVDNHMSPLRTPGNRARACERG
jgi:hypothetical protein